MGAGGGHVIRNNLFFAPERTSIGKSDSEYLAVSNLEKDPMFANPERLDFHLTKGSPAIDAWRGRNARGDRLR